MLFPSFVISLRGRDKGKTFIVIDSVDSYLLLVDGKSRTFQKPKRKNLRHVMPLPSLLIPAPQGRLLTNADARRLTAAARAQFSHF